MLAMLSNRTTLFILFSPASYRLQAMLAYILRVKNILPLVRGASGRRRYFHSGGEIIELQWVVNQNLSFQSRIANP